MNTILFATDGSPTARRAEEEAIAVAKATGWELRVVTVWHIPPVTSFGYLPGSSLVEVSEAEHDRAREIVEDVVGRARKAGVAATFELREGYAPGEICDAAKETDARLIVIGAHGWGAVKRVIFGSVSNAVLHHAPCGVLVVHGEDPDADPSVTESEREAVLR